MYGGGKSDSVFQVVLAFKLSASSKFAKLSVRHYGGKGRNPVVLNVYTMKIKFIQL